VFPLIIIIIIIIIMVHKLNGKKNISPQHNLCPGRYTSRPNSTLLRYIKLLPLCVCVCVWPVGAHPPRVPAT
jgi:hypothetical protein